MSERLRRIVAEMAIQPGDRILEIGCGHGVAIGYMAAYLRSGFVTGLDRSARMIEMARRRHADLLAAGRVEFIVAEFERFDPGSARFDKILAARVGIFHREPERAHGLAKSWLRRGGRLFVEYDEPR